PRLPSPTLFRSSSPAARAIRSASAAAALWSATRRFATSLRSIACPARPMKTADGRMVSSRGRQRSNTPRSPPTNTIPSPRATIALVPLIGASRNASPFAVTSRARRSVSAGEMVLIWMMVRPGGPATARPRDPSTTSSTDARDGRTTHTASAASATASAVGAARPPTAAAAPLARPHSQTRLAARVADPPPPPLRSHDPIHRLASRRASPSLRGRRSARTTPFTDSPRGARRRASAAAARLARPSAVPARRVVARVHGIFQVLLGLVRPELGDAREGVDHRVLEAAARLLDPAHVDVLNRVAEVVEPDGAARGVGEIRAAKRPEELVGVLDVASGGLPRRLQLDARH